MLWLLLKCFNNHKYFNKLQYVVALVNMIPENWQLLDKSKFNMKNL
jgi:hypothetical protein